MATEHEDLDQFVHTQGWLRFCQFAEKEWNDRFGEHVRQAINDPDDIAALRKLQQVQVAKDAVHRLLKWPFERIAELERAEKGRTVSPSRRGSL